MREYSQTKQVLRLLFWETTIKCNLACAHCRRLESDDAASSDLSTEQAKSLIKQLAELGTRQASMPVLVFSGGEPLCRGDLFDLVEYARSLDIAPALATNATLINSTVAARINESGVVRVAVSLDGATAEIHDRLRQLEGAFESAVTGIRHLRDKNVSFQINITLTRSNAEQLEEVYRLAKSLGAVAVHVFMLVPVGCGQALAETDMLAPEQYEQKMVDICRLDSRGELQMKVTCGPHYERVVREQGLHGSRKGISRRAGSIPGRTGHGSGSRGCLAGLGVVFVGHQGDVFPCGYLPVKCGNVLEEELGAIWRESRDLARMRDGSDLRGKCGLCSYRQVCGGCRGRAYAATGDYMAAEPFCAYIPPGAAGVCL
ncbi:MAG: radical SAM protein [Phycisphaerales bacterium]|nr:MAG: radical SAM protein [Phycisphaerales bacterium]